MAVDKIISKCVICNKLLQLLGFKKEKEFMTNFSFFDLSKNGNIEWIIFKDYNILNDPMSDKRYGVKLKRAGKPIGLEFKSGQKYTTSYKLKQNLPAFIKIYCLQLNETIESSKCSKLLAICPGIDKNDSGIYHYQPLTEHFFLLGGEINQMNF